MTTASLRMHINLSGIAGRIQRLLKQTTYMAAIGIRATEALSQESLEMPELTFVFQYDHTNPWTVEEAQVNWRKWVLTNAFRDTAEVIASILEEAQHVLAVWSLLEPKLQGQTVKAERWNNEVVHRASQFHRRTLPQKLDYLRSTYGFTLEKVHEEELLSINAMRNCFVHRGGQVGNIDIDASGSLHLKWRQMTPYVEVDGVTSELKLPFYAEKETLMTIEIQSKTKAFAVGEGISVTLGEFTGVCWTIFTIAQRVGETLESYARDKGFLIGEKEA